MKAKVVWVDDFQFMGVSPSGHGIILDSPEKTGYGPSPMELVLIALAGCTGMDVISILEKMKKNVKRFEVSCEGERAEEHPRVYKKIRVHYLIEGKDIDDASVKRAIELSKEKYCSVSIMLSKAAEISFTYEIKVSQ